MFFNYGRPYYNNYNYGGSFGNNCSCNCSGGSCRCRCFNNTPYFQPYQQFQPFQPYPYYNRPRRIYW